jgi:hypothetical protein
MRYPEFRSQQLFIGSGVIEAGYKNDHRFPLQAIRHVLDSSRGKRHTGTPLLPLQWAV